MFSSENNTLFFMNLTVLVVEDDLDQLDILKSFINTHGGNCLTAGTFLQSIDFVETHQFDVVLCNIRLDNNYTGFDFVDKANEIDPELTIILTSGYDPDLFMSTIMNKNIYAFVNKPYQLMSLGLLLLQASRNTKNLRKNIYLAENLRTKIVAIQKERDKIFFNTLTSLTNALEQKDEYTKNHSEMVGRLSEKICQEYTDNEIFTEDVTIAGRLHDIGKIGIHDNILLKKSRLTDEEYEVIKKHPEMSYKIIKPVDNIGNISDYVLHHHERWNGQGYPYKMKEKAIPIGSRILAVADVFNALTSCRPYREAKSVEFALKILFDGRCVEFDPEFVEIFYKLIRAKRIDV